MLMDAFYVSLSYGSQSLYLFHLIIFIWQMILITLSLAYCERDQNNLSICFTD